MLSLLTAIFAPVMPMRTAVVEAVLPEVVTEEVLRNAAAYGWEIGMGWLDGKPMTETVTSSFDNPFMVPNWRDLYLVKDVPNV